MRIVPFTKARNSLKTVLDQVVPVFGQEGLMIATG